MIVVTELWFIFAKLQLWFHLDHYYRTPGFFNNITQLLSAFDEHYSYEIIAERVFNHPDAYWEDAHSHISGGCAELPLSPEDLAETNRRLSEINFCIAVWVVAHELHGTSVRELIDIMDEGIETSEERDRFRAVLSTITDLRTCNQMVLPS